MKTILMILAISLTTGNSLASENDQLKTDFQGYEGSPHLESLNYKSTCTRDSLGNEESESSYEYRNSEKE